MGRGGGKMRRKRKGWNGEKGVRKEGKKEGKRGRRKAERRAEDRDVRCELGHTPVHSREVPPEVPSPAGCRDVLGIHHHWVTLGKRGVNSLHTEVIYLFQFRNAANCPQSVLSFRQSKLTSVLESPEPC